MAPPGGIDVLRAIFGLEVDQAPFDRGLKDAEQKAGESTQKIEQKFSNMSVAIATGISLLVVASLKKAIDTTAAWGIEMEMMSARMGVTHEEAGKLVGMLERYGIQSQQAAAALAMLSLQMEMTTKAADPFATRLGKVMGSLRDVNGQLMTMPALLKAGREKIQETTGALAQLQVAQVLFGSDMGGRLLPILRLSQDEWDNLGGAVEASGIVIGEEMSKMSLAMKNATSSINQSLRGLAIQFGEVLLPIVVAILEPLSEMINKLTSIAKARPEWVMAAVFIGGVVAPIVAVVGAVTLLSRGWTMLSTVMTMSGASMGQLTGVMTVAQAEMRAVAGGQTAAAVATKGHTAAIQQQTVAVQLNTAAQARRTVATGAGAAASVAGGAAAAGGGGMLAAAGGGLLAVAAPALIGVAIGTMLLSFLTGNMFKRFLFGGDPDKAEALQRKLEALELEAEGKKAAGGTKFEEEVDRKAELTAIQAQTKAAQEGAKLRTISAQELSKAIDKELEAIKLRRLEIQEQLAGGLKSEQRAKIEADRIMLRNQEVQLIASRAMEGYRQEELALKSIGALGLQQEIDLLERKLADERIVGDARLEIEGQVFEKRQSLLEQTIGLARQLGGLSVEGEIGIRQQRAEEAFARGRVDQAAQELVKIRDLALQQADAVMDFQKKIRIVSLAEEIDFNKAKLDLVKGNAEQEMNILGNIAQLDKQLYDQRLSYVLSYTKSAQDASQQVFEAFAERGGDVQTFARARVQSERQLRQAGREARGVLRGGGTEAQREAAVNFAQNVFRQAEEQQRLGIEASANMRSAIEAARDILEAASGMKIRAPGDELSVGSLTSPSEGLATSALARGSEIPRLDTSFTDLAVRVRDVLLGTIPNLQSFSNAIAEATKKIGGEAVFPSVFEGGQQFRGPLATGGGTPAPSRFQLVSEPGRVPFAARAEMVERETAQFLRESAEVVRNGIDSLIQQNRERAEETQTAFQEFQQMAQSIARGELKVTFDETGQLVGTFVKKTIEEELTS